MPVSLEKSCKHCINGVRVADRIFTDCVDGACAELIRPCEPHSCYRCGGSGLMCDTVPDSDAGTFRLDPWGEDFGARIELRTMPTEIVGTTPIFMLNR